MRIKLLHRTKIDSRGRHKSASPIDTYTSERFDNWLLMTMISFERAIGIAFRGHSQPSLASSRVKMTSQLRELRTNCQRAFKLCNRGSVMAVTLVLFLVACCAGSLAQSGAGGIQGTITDSTGAVVPETKVEVANQETGVTNSARSNKAGFYQVPGLFTGHYRVTLTASGFKTYTTHLDLLVAQNAVVNASLTAGAVTEQVDVSANTVQLTSPDSGTLTATLENQRINQLPMNGRNLLTLTQITTPGMEQGGTSVNGIAAEGLEYVSDGAPNFNDAKGGASSLTLQDPDSIQEVRIVTLNGGAQYSAPGVAIITTKSGTNQFHGSLFETARNSAFGIAKARQDPSNYAAPQLIRNEFGFSAGGPIILPHIYHGKNKSFWFFAYERYSLASSPSLQLKVPTMAMRQGDFSQAANSLGVVPTIYNPASTYSTSNCAATPSHPANTYCRTPYSNNQIPISRISPTAKVFFGLLPQPTSAADPLVQANLTGTYKEYQVTPNISARIDHSFNENNSMYVKYSYIAASPAINTVQSPANPMSLAADGIPAGAAEGVHYITNTSNLASVAYTHVFSPTFFAETVASQQWFNYSNGWGTGNSSNFEQMLGLPNNTGQVGFPALGNGTLINNANTSQNNYASDQLVSTIDENMTKTLGRHQVQFGGRFRHERIAYQNHTGGDAISFNALPTGVYDPSTGVNYGNRTNAGLADASFFLGSAATYSLVSPGLRLHSHLMDFDAYIQDNFHLSKTLTLNLGLRWEGEPGFWSKDGVGSSFDFKNDAMVLPVPTSTLVAKGIVSQAIITNDENIGVKFETPDQAGMPSNLIANSYRNFLPRIGFAYQPFGGRFGTVVRGGYGRYAYFTNTGNYSEQWGNANPFKSSFSQSYTSASQSIDGLPNELLRYDDPIVFGVMGANTANVVNTNATNGILPGIANPFTSPNWPPALADETNFTIEQPLRGNSVLRVSWVWTHGSNLDTVFFFNNHPTTYQWEMATGITPPTGGASVIGTSQQNTYSATATGPYDQTTWGNSKWDAKNGWSNDNAMQLSYERLFHRGIAYQVSYVFSKAMRMGGDVNEGTDTAVTNTYPVANYPGVLGTAGTMTSPYGLVYSGALPPPRPAGTPVWADYHALDRYENYMLDTTIPTHHVKFNGIVDLPVGRGKRFLGNANGFLNEIVGGFQIAGAGNVVSQAFRPSAGHWGAISPVRVYKHRHPITDCRSGVCEKSYMWFNGYLPPTVTTGVSGSACASNCVSGLPTDYVPMQTPIDNTPGSTYYGTDDVVVTLANGKQTTIPYDAGPIASNYMAKSYLQGPINYTVDLSIFKVFPITQTVNLRLNVDAFNAFNIQGYNNPGTDGVENLLSSHNAPRQIQFTARLTY